MSHPRNLSLPEFPNGPISQAQPEQSETLRLLVNQPIEIRPQAFHSRLALAMPAAPTLLRLGPSGVPTLRRGIMRLTPSLLFPR